MPTKKVPVNPSPVRTSKEKPTPVIGIIKTPVPDVPKPGQTTKKNTYTQTYKEKSNKYSPVPPKSPSPKEPAKPLEPKPVIGQIKLPKPKMPVPPLKGSKQPDTYTPVYPEGPRRRRKARVGPPKPPVR